MADKNLYNKDSIESLSPLEFTRLRPQVYAGDCTYSTQLLVEIVSNAVDEFRLGHGDKIEVTIDKDKKNKDFITVRDYGQGFLINEKRRHILPSFGLLLYLVLIFLVLLHFEKTLSEPDCLNVRILK